MNTGEKINNRPAVQIFARDLRESIVAIFIKTNTVATDETADRALREITTVLKSIPIVWAYTLDARDMKYPIKRGN